MYAKMTEVLSVRLSGSDECCPCFIWLSGQIGRGEQRLAKPFVVGAQGSKCRDGRVVVANGYPAEHSCPRQRLSKRSLTTLLGRDLLRDGVSAQGGNGKL